MPEDIVQSVLRVFLVCCFGLLPLMAGAQQAGTGDESEDLKRQIERLKLEKEKAELEKQKAELERDRVKAERDALREALPKSEIKALEGKITVGENVVLPGNILAYRSASEIASDLAGKIKSLEQKPTTIITYSEKELMSIAAYHSVLIQVRALVEGYERHLPQPDVVAAQALPAALLAPEFATTLLKSVAELVALFRTEVEIKGFAVNVEEIAVVAELARALREKDAGVKVIYTPSYVPVDFLRDPTSKSDLALQLSALYRYRRRASERVAEYEGKGDAERKAVEDKLRALKALNELTDKLTSYLTGVDEKTGLNALTVLLKAERLSQTAAGAAILLTKVHIGAGSNKTTRNLFTGSKLYHQGGAVITFLLLDSAGAIRFSKTYHCASEYTEFKAEGEVKFIKNF